MRSPKRPAAAHSASVCCGCLSPVSAAKPTTSASVTVLPGVTKRSPGSISSKWLANTLMQSPQLAHYSSRDTPMSLVRGVEAVLGEVVAVSCAGMSGGLQHDHPAAAGSAAQRCVVKVHPPLDPGGRARPQRQEARQVRVAHADHERLGRLGADPAEHAEQAHGVAAGVRAHRLEHVVRAAYERDQIGLERQRLGQLELLDVLARGAHRRQVHVAGAWQLAGHRVWPRALALEPGREAVAEGGVGADHSGTFPEPLPWRPAGASADSADSIRVRVSEGSTSSSMCPPRAAISADTCSSLYSSASSPRRASGSSASASSRLCTMLTACFGPMIPISASGQANARSAPRSFEFIVM